MKVPAFNLHNFSGRQWVVVVDSAEYTELQPLLSSVHSVMRVKLVLAGGGGVHAHPLLLHLPSPEVEFKNEQLG